MHRLRTSLFVLLGLFAAQLVTAQGTEPEPVDKFRKTFEFTMPNPGKPESTSVNVVRPVYHGSGVTGVHYKSEPGIMPLVQMHKRRNAETEEMEGFRIQIYAGGDLNLANEARADFIASFPDDYEAYQTWQPPHFRVRVGDFRARQEAMRELSTVRQIFPDAFIVSDKIKLRKSRRAASTPSNPDPDAGGGSDEEEDEGRIDD